MGVAIHYHWRVETDFAGARKMVEALHATAKKIGFDKVGRIREDRWGKRQLPKTRAELKGFMRRHLGKWHILNDDDMDAHMRIVEPIYTCGFVAEIKGVDPITAGLALHPRTIKGPCDWGKKEVSTGLDGDFAWTCNCDTKLACVPENGGWPHFLAAHKKVIALLNAAKKLGFRPDVWDEGGYWKKPDEKRLRKRVDDALRLAAAFAGELKDGLEFSLRDDANLGPILRHPEFERLEAEGDKLLSKPNPKFVEMLRAAEAEEEDWGLFKREPAFDDDE